MNRLTKILLTRVFSTRVMIVNSMENSLLYRHLKLVKRVDISVKLDKSALIDYRISFFKTNKII